MRFASAAVRRLGHSSVLLASVVGLSFILIHLAPGDPAQVLAGEAGGGNPETLERINEAYGFNLPIHSQIWQYTKKLATGDFGYSYYYNEPVLQLIGDRLWPSLLLSGTALVIAVVVGTLLGVLAARRPKSPISHTVTAVSLFGFSAPVFWTGMVLILLFAVEIPIFPTSGMSSYPPPDDVLNRTLDIAHHMFLPVTALASVYVAVYSRISRASMIETLGSDYIRTAWAKGLDERKVFLKHGLRNAILPVITLVGVQLGAILSSAVLVEVVFNWPGIGTLVLSSILRRDTPLVLGILLASAALVIVANLLTDLSYGLVDPRIRLGEE